VPDSSDPAFTKYFLAGVLFRSMLGGVAMLFGAAGVALGNLTSWDWAPFLGGCAGLAIGFFVAALVKHHWDPLDHVPDVVPPDFPIDPRL
jgi:hypothetical protein